jgi:hypothetical protein
MIRETPRRVFNAFRSTGLVIQHTHACTNGTVSKRSRTCLLGESNTNETEFTEGNVRMPVLVRLSSVALRFGAVLLVYFRFRTFLVRLMVMVGIL